MFLRRLYISSTRSYVKYSSPVFQRNITRSYSIATQYSYNRFTLPQVRGELLLKCMPHRPTTVFSVRALSSGTESVEEKPLEVIDLTESATESSSVESMINTISQTDLPLTALHLGSNYTPIGWCLHYLDFLHSAFPWWGSIAIGTLILRLCMFPFAVQSQRTSAKLNEILPEQAILKEKMNQARVVGDSIEFARLSNEFNTLFKRKGVNPLKAMAMPFLQIPAFLTFFLTLRRMANHPVESLKTGGIFWFTDLSIPDPLHALPILTSLTLWLTLEISFRTGLNPNQTPIIKYGARVIPFVTLFFVYDFPSAILTYWFTNNCISVVQVVLMRQPRFREFLNIPQIKVNPANLEVNKKSFTKHFQETMDNAKINKLLEERKTIDEVAFKKAGIGPLKKTFKQPPA